MTNLDSIDQIKALDVGGLVNSIYKLPFQVEQAWKEVTQLSFKEDYSNVKNIVVAGMGGSALGSRIIDSYLIDNLNIPLETVTDFKLPHYVNSETLVILSSYSGGTVETINCFYDAQKRAAKVFAITTGGNLGDLIKQTEMDFYIFDPINNPCGQPRMALGYSVASLLSFLVKTKFITSPDVGPLINSIKSNINELSLESPEDTNLAKTLAKKLKGKFPILISAEHLIGVAHAFKNQLNENSKSFATLFDLPELNHHLLEGLRNPALIKSNLAFIIFESDLYSPEINKLIPIVKEILVKNELEVISFKLLEKDKLKQIFESLAFGSFVSYYLALVYDIDPTPIPWVKYLKDKL